MFFGPPGSGSGFISTRYGPDPSMINKNSKKSLNILLFCDFFYDFLSLKNYVNVASKSNEQKNGTADPDPYQNVTGPQNWS